MILRDEEVWSNGNFGPLKNIPLPPKPLSYVVRAFGDDCMAVLLRGTGRARPPSTKSISAK